MSILISGTIAYDYIMDFPDTFRNHILPDKIHMLNVCFVVDQLKKEYGGTAGNIAYTMKLLGGDPIIFSPVGSDGRDYLEYLKKLGIRTSYMPVIEDRLTASAHITTDKDDNQITAFYNGAHDRATNLHVGDVAEMIDFAIVGPTDKRAMIQHAKECYDHHIPFVCDPGQQMTTLGKQELMAMIGQAKMYMVNDYEMQLTKDKTGWGAEELLEHVGVVVQTFGPKGSLIMTKEKRIEIQPCPPKSVDDPTGAGDAYRAGFFTAHVNGHDLKTCGQMGSVAAAYAIEHYGTQNHAFTATEFQERYKSIYGETISLLGQ